MLTKHQNAVKIKEKQLEKLDLKEWIMEEKFKGIRCWRIKRGSEVQLITRGLEDISHNFPHLIDIDWTPSLDQSQLDCELYDPAQEDEIVSGWAMRSSIDPEHVEGCILKAFDILDYNGNCLKNVKQLERKKILHSLRLRGAVEEVPYMPALLHRKYYEHIISTPNKYGKFGEGIMLKNINSDYREGSRKVTHWFKRKKRDPFDCVVLGFTKAKEGKFYGLIGAVRFGQFVNGSLREVGQTSGMADDVRKDMTLRPEFYIGKACSVFAVEQNRNSLALIEPSWKGLRIDKLPEDCTVNFNNIQEPEEDQLCEL